MAIDYILKFDKENTKIRYICHCVMGRDSFIRDKAYTGFIDASKIFYDGAVLEGLKVLDGSSIVNFLVGTIFSCIFLLYKTKLPIQVGVVCFGDYFCTGRDCFYLLTHEKVLFNMVVLLR